MADLKLAVLISGRGSNLQALIDACADEGYPATIVIVIADRPGAPGLERAEGAHIPTAVIERRHYDGRSGFDEALSTAITARGADLVCLAGFMAILGPDFVARWRDRLINIHPSLLPDFPGLDTHQRAIAAGVGSAGCTVHFVRAEVDAGPIILQQPVPVAKGDTAQTLAARVLEAEHRIYPRAVRLIAEGRVKIIDEHVRITTPE